MVERLCGGGGVFGGLPLRRRRGQGPHLAKRWEPRGFSRAAAPVWGFTRNTTGSSGSVSCGPGKSGLH